MILGSPSMVDGPAESAARRAMHACLKSRPAQIAGIAAMFLLISAFHRHGDGLWFQGDAPRHAVNGLFWWDLLTALPANPMEFAVRYYARYPVINPASYPPLFYVFEGLAFAVVGPSPHAAKALVLLYAVIAGMYTMAWGRQWIGVYAGWAGAFLAFIPGMVTWSNTVMLNVPSMALGLAALFHLRRWFETARTRQLVAAALLSAAVLLTYYPGAIVLCICIAWAVLRGRNLRFDWSLVRIAFAGLVALVPLAAALYLAPVHTSRHLPTIAALTDSTIWTFYWKALPNILSGPALVLGSAGVVAGLLSARWRTEALYLAIWIGVPILTLSVLPARDPRYLLLVAPAFLIAAAIALTGLSRYIPTIGDGWYILAMATGLGLGVWSAARIQVPQVSGFLEIATYLRQHAPKDAVLYDGHYDGTFGFYFRALDRDFERRMVRADRLLYSYGPTTTFAWVQRSNVTSTDDVVRNLRERCGCRWVAIEAGRMTSSVAARRLLTEALTRPEFELVRSFPITAVRPFRVYLYRMVDPMAPIVEVDVDFPSFSNQGFTKVAPITR